jgi:DNA repair photolyase
MPLFCLGVCYSVGMDGEAHIRGRGAGVNPANRFERVHVAPEPGFAHDAFDDEPAPPKTEVFWDDSKSVIVYHKNPDIPIPASMNIYRGCEHGCSYCYARQYHEYLGLSTGLDFESKIFVKRNAAGLLRQTFFKPSWKPQVVSLSGATDVYQPLEARLRVTREVLKVFAEFRNPVGIITKNALVTRDLDVLAELAAHRCVSVVLSITTLDEDLRRVLEPRTSTIARRFEAIRKLTEAGVPLGVNVAPIIPGLTDEDMPGILKRAREAGARWAGMTVLRLPYSVAEVFEAWLEAHYPGRKEKVMRRVHEANGGGVAGRAFERDYSGRGARVEGIFSLFEIARRKAGFIDGERSGMTAKNFRRPGSTRDMF